MFKIAEDNIHREFNNFQPLHIAQLLCSFVYIDRVPVNFASRILAPSFWIRCKGWSVSTHYSEYIGKWNKCCIFFQRALQMFPLCLSVYHPFFFRFRKNLLTWILCLSFIEGRHIVYPKYFFFHSLLLIQPFWFDFMRSQTFRSSLSFIQVDYFSQS